MKIVNELLFKIAGYTKRHSLIAVLEIGDFAFSRSLRFFTAVAGLPRFADSDRSKRWFARRCWGVWTIFYLLLDMLLLSLVSALVLILVMRRS